VFQKLVNEIETHRQDLEDFQAASRHLLDIGQNAELQDRMTEANEQYNALLSTAKVIGIVVVVKYVVPFTMTSILLREINFIAK